METIEVLKSSTIEGNVIKLPKVQLDRKQYLDIKKTLEKIGGKWKGGKVSGFIFDNDPTELIERVIGGEKVNLKKDFQFFATPAELADRMVRYSGLQMYEPEDVDVLEPSAGDGAIIDSIHRVHHDCIVDCYELMPQNRKKLGMLSNINLIGEDFLQSSTYKKYDLIIANPPFTKGQDIEHIMAMYERLKMFGKIVTIASCSWEYVNTKKAQDFRGFLESVSAHTEDIPEGEFKKSGTNVPTKLITICKTSINE